MENINQIIQEFITDIENPNKHLNRFLYEFISRLHQVDTSNFSQRQINLLQGLIDRLIPILEL